MHNSLISGGSGYHVQPCCVIYCCSRGMCLNFVFVFVINQQHGKPVSLWLVPSQLVVNLGFYDAAPLQLLAPDSVTAMAYRQLHVVTCLCSCAARQVMRPALETCSTFTHVCLSISGLVTFIARTCPDVFVACYIATINAHTMPKARVACPAQETLAT